MRLAVAVILGVTSSAPSAHAEALGTAAFVPLGDLSGGAFHSIATAISADGSTVVGYSKSSPAESPDEAFRWTADEGLVGLGGLSQPPSTRSRGVSADGSRIVLSGDGPWPILWTATEGLVELPDTTGLLVSASAFDLSPDGSTLVGVAQSSAEAANQAFRWTATIGYEPLGWLPSTIHDSFMTGASADGSVLAGFGFHHGFDVEPMIWTEATGLDSLGDVPGGDPYALAWGISEDGTTVVGDAHIGGTSEPWLWRADTGFVRPDPLHGAGGGGWFEAVSADGSVAVGVPAIVWDDERGIRRVADVLTNAGVDVSNWLLQAATDVSADGRTVVGYGRNPAGDTEAWLARLPEPAVSVPAPDSSPLVESAMLGANPASGPRSLRLELPANSRVIARVFAVDGRCVATLVDAPLAEGTHVLTWDGRTSSGRWSAPGAYVLRVVAGKHVASHTIITLR